MTSAEVLNVKEQLHIRTQLRVINDEQMYAKCPLKYKIGILCEFFNIFTQTLDQDTKQLSKR